MKDLFLGPLTYDETAELMRSLGLVAGLQFDDQSMKYIYSKTSGHPLFTRVLGSQISSMLKNGNVTPQVIEDATKKYLTNNSERALLVKIYDESLDTNEKEIVKKLAIEKTAKRSSLLTNYTDNEKKRLIRDAINNLIDTTVIQQDENNILQIRYELLRMAIEQEVEELGL